MHMSRSATGMTQLIHESDNYITAVAKSGRHVGVSFSPSSIHVYIHANGRRHLPHGKHFFATNTQEAFLKGIAHYKSHDIQNALRAVLSALV